MPWISREIGDSEEGSLEGTRYRLGFFRRLGDRSGRHFFLELSSTSPVRFKVSREKYVDRLSKWVGLSREIQTGDSQFDQDFYIDAEAVPSARSFFDSLEVRHAIQKLLDSGYTYVESGGLRLKAVKLHAWHKPNQGELEIAVRKLARLSKRAASLPPVGRRSPGPMRRILLLLALPSILLATTCQHGCLHEWAHPDSSFVLDLGALSVDSLRYSLPSLVVYLLVSGFLLRGRSSSHRDLLPVILLAGIAFLWAARETEDFVNSEFDRGNASTHSAVLVSKEPREQHDRDHRRVLVRSWRIGHTTESLWVTDSTYDWVEPDRDSFTVVTKPVRLGFEWVVSLRIN
jgi:hypothetical protein